jgi:5-methyltetrahydrofolate--homocysteine methyltransferase
MIRESLKKRILVIDGAMGTMIQKYNLSEADFRKASTECLKSSIRELDQLENPLFGNNDLLSLTRPDVISQIHEAYLQAGADIIETNTFSSTSISQADYGTEAFVYDINYFSAKLAKEAAKKFINQNPDRPRYVAGSIGPTNQTASMSPNVNDPAFRAVSFNDLSLAYELQCQALLDGGVDAFLIETIFDTLNAKAAIFAAAEINERNKTDLPIMLSATITDKSGRTLSGQTLEAFLVSVEHANALSVGLNCAFGAEQLLPYIKELSDKFDGHISVYPNAGLPNEFGSYDQTAAIMQDKVKPFFELGLVNIIGGCCGTTPDHIKAIAELAKDYSPREKVYV